MLAANYDITLDRAADYQLVLTILDSASSPVNISAATFYADVRNTIDKAEVTSFTCTPSVSPTNEVTLSLSENQTKLLSPSVSYEWDLYMIRSGTNTDRLLYGSLTCRDNRTNNV